MKERPATPQERHKLYFSLFHGASVSHRELVTESPLMQQTVKTLMESGLIQAQETLDGDMMLSIPRLTKPEEGV